MDRLIEVLQKLVGELRNLVDHNDPITVPNDIYLSMPDADTEYKLTLPPHTVAFVIQTQDGTAFRFAVRQGGVATSAPPYVTVPLGGSYEVQGLNTKGVDGGLVLYVACSTAAKAIQGIAWSRAK